MVGSGRWAAGGNKMKNERVGDRPDWPGNGVTTPPNSRPGIVITDIR